MDTQDKVYWANYLMGSIQRANLIDGSNVETVAKPASLMPWGLVTDTPRCKMYIADQASNTILVANLAGWDWEVFVDVGKTHGNDQPVALWLDTTEDMLYWTQRSSRIFRTSILGDGSESEEMDTSASGDYSMDRFGIAVDTNASPRKVYYADNQEWVIWRQTWGDVDETDFVWEESAIYEPLELDIDPVGRYLYWAEAGLKEIRRIGLDGDGVSDVQTLVSADDAPLGLTVSPTLGVLHFSTDTSIVQTGLAGNKIWEILLPDTYKPRSLAVVNGTIAHEMQCFTTTTTSTTTWTATSTATSTITTSSSGTATETATTATTTETRTATTMIETTSTTRTTTFTSVTTTETTATTTTMMMMMTTAAATALTPTTKMAERTTVVAALPPKTTAASDDVTTVGEATNSTATTSTTASTTRPETDDSDDEDTSDNNYNNDNNEKDIDSAVGADDSSDDSEDDDSDYEGVGSSNHTNNTTDEDEDDDDNDDDDDDDSDANSSNTNNNTTAATIGDTLPGGDDKHGPLEKPDDDGDDSDNDDDSDSTSMATITIDEGDDADDPDFVVIDKMVFEKGKMVADADDSDVVVVVSGRSHFEAARWLARNTSNIADADDSDVPGGKSTLEGFGVAKDADDSDVVASGESRLEPSQLARGSSSSSSSSSSSIADADDSDVLGGKVMVEGAKVARSTSIAIDNKDLSELHQSTTRKRLRAAR